MQIIVCSICHASVGAYGALAVIIVVLFDDFSAFSFIEWFGTKGRWRLIPKLNRTANSLISISNDGPNNHTYKILYLNELAKFPRHHRCFYELHCMGEPYWLTSFFTIAIRCYTVHVSKVMYLKIVRRSSRCSLAHFSDTCERT